MNKLKKIMYKIYVAGIIFISGIITRTIPAFASDTNSKEVEKIIDAIINPLNILLAVIVAGLAVAGGFIITKNITELSVAVQQQDSTGMFHAIRGIISGVLLAATGLILGIFGIKV